MQGVRYDQRVLALVEVRGRERDWEQAEREFEQRGWPLVDGSVRGEGISAGVLRPDPASRLYVVEVRLFGARNRRTERAAVWRVERLAKAARLEMHVRRCELVERDRELLTEWLVHTVAHRPARRPAHRPAGGPPPRPLTVAGRLRRQLALERARYTERRGRHDTGMLVTGTASEARRLSRMTLPGGGAPAGTGTDVRPLYGKERAHIVARREEDRQRWMYRLFAWLAAMSFCAVVARQQSGFRVWLWSLFAAACFAAALRVGSRMFLSGGRALSVFVTSVVSGFLLFLAIGPGAPEGGWPPSQVLTLAAALTTVTGIWLLVRQWTWGEWLAWAAPVAFTVLASFVVASGSVLHAIYATELGLSPGDLDVPGIWQAISALKVLSFLSVALVVPALWGMAKHLHVTYLRPGEQLNAPLYVVAQILVVAQVLLLALDSAGAAVDTVRSAAEHRTRPPAYFGVEPTWMCVEPTVPKAELNVQDGELDPARPLLSFGVTDGEAALWHQDTEAAFKVPAAQVRLLPADHAKATCAFPARAWEAAAG
ncbi:NnrS multi-domain protein [Streptomyces sp. NPDC057137]|uniref:NnrS multi-domain protein n=1 Tax=Streptomyces sp. NPDC057137 TaxID=3346030 RepID=UPI0036286189